MSMPTPLRLLILEDQPSDAELVLYTLRQAGFVPDWQRVETEADYLAQLHPSLAVILADYALPQFDAMRALQLLQERGLDVPFIVVTGSISEEVAVECIKQGAADYVLKEGLQRLGPAVTRALAEKRLRDDKRRAEAALRDSEARYRELFENAHDIIYTHDLEGNFTSFNRAAERITGYTREEGLRMSIAQVVTPESLGLARQMFANKLAGAPSTAYDVEILTKTGQRVPLEISTRLMYAGDQPIGVQGIARDITERQRAQAALRESEERYRQLVEHSPDGISIDCHGIFVFINTAGATLFGAAHPEQLLGKSVFDFIHPAYHEAVRARRQQVYDTGYAEPAERQLIRLDGQVIDVEISVIATSYQGQPAIQAVIRDITGRKRLEAQLRQAQKMEAIGTLAGGIAHDFNNILAALLGFTELALLDMSEDSRAWQNLQEVLVAGQRAKKLIQQILTFSRQTEQERKPVQLSLIIKEALSLLRASLPSTIDIHQQITAVAATVWADATQMHQVLMNLGTNAAYAMRDSGGILDVHLDPIEVDAAFAAVHPELRPGPYVRLTVRDTGQGMTPEARERIFDPFFTTKDVHEGTGLGLAVVHGIVTSHEGAITVESAPGQGTTFAIYLPRIEETGADATYLDASLPGGSEHVLFVDDEVALARLGQEMLEHLGYTVTVRTSSIEALEAFRTMPRRFDLVITDQTMPNMTGETLAREMRRLRPELPIILCTGFSHTITAEKAQMLRLNAFLMKPLTTRELAVTIRQVFDRLRTP
jgi:PAS domain S-box-containing protein